jgi:hypothetical protein
MLQWATTTTDGRRSPPNPTAEAAYHFAHHPGLAGEPAGLDLAQIWLGPARSGLPFFFFPVFYLLAKLSAAIKISLKMF